MIRARNVGAQRVGVAVVSIAKTLVEIWKEKRKKAIKKKRIERENIPHSGSTVCLHPDWLQPVEGPIIAGTQSLIHRTGFADVTSCFLF